MSTYNYAPGAVHLDFHHNNISMSTSQITDLVRSFMSERTEDVEPEIVSDETEKTPDEKRLFCRITKAAYEKGVAWQVEDDLRSACISAPKLVKALKTNDALGYTDTQNLYSTDLYDMLDEHYGLPFKRHAFSVARSK